MSGNLRRSPRANPHQKPRPLAPSPCQLRSPAKRWRPSSSTGARCSGTDAPPPSAPPTWASRKCHLGGGGGARRDLRFAPSRCSPRALPEASGIRAATQPTAKDDDACQEEKGSTAKKQRNSDTDKGDAILHVLEEMNKWLQAYLNPAELQMNKSLQASLNPAEFQQVPKEAAPEEIFEALKTIPKLARVDLLRAYSMLTCDDRQFRSLMALPMNTRKDWLLMEIGNK